MDLGSMMGFLEAMATTGFPPVAAFFIGLMMAISPCPMVTNVTAIAYLSKRLGGSRDTLLAGAMYTAGRMATYLALSSLIVWLGMSAQSFSFSLQSFSSYALGPFLFAIGMLMLFVDRLPVVFKGSERLNAAKERIAQKRFGGFLLGMVLAMAFCPFSAVLFFGMMIPLALSTGDAIIVPGVFAIATGLPVIVASFAITKGVSKIGAAMSKMQAVQKYFSFAIAALFMVAGIYYAIIAFL